MTGPPETDAVKILYDRYVKGDPDREAALRSERIILVNDLSKMRLLWFSSAPPPEDDVTFRRVEYPR